MLLQLLVMLAAEKGVMEQTDTVIPDMMAEAHSFHWEYIDAKTYQDILDWQKSHCDATMVLHTGSCLSLALRSVVNTRMFIAVVVVLTGIKMMKYSFIRCFESSVWY